MGESIDAQYNRAIKDVEFFRAQAEKFHQQLHECEDWEKIYQEWIGSLKLMGDYPSLEDYVEDRIIKDRAEQEETRLRSS